MAENVRVVAAKLLRIDRGDGSSEAKRLGGCERGNAADGAAPIILAPSREGDRAPDVVGSRSEGDRIAHIGLCDDCVDCSSIVNVAWRDGEGISAAGGGRIVGIRGRDGYRPADWIAVHCRSGGIGGLFGPVFRHRAPISQPELIERSGVN